MTRLAALTVIAAIATFVLTAGMDRYLMMGHEGLAVRTTLVLPLAWLGLLIWTMRRNGKRSRWLLALVPLVFFWPGVFVLLIVACMAGGDCL